jgi:actin
LFASGRGTGTVVQAGGGVTHVVSIHEGTVIAGSEVKIDIGGNDIDEYLQSLLGEKLKEVFSSLKSDQKMDDELTVVRKIKESLGYVSEVFDSELQKPASVVDQKFELADGRTIVVGHERFKCGEALFKPSLLGRDEVGIVEAIRDSIGKCDVNFKAILSMNVVLAGGSCSFSGLKTRLSNELNCPSTDPVANASKSRVVVSPSDLKDVTWTGGSILSSLSTFESK